MNLGATSETQVQQASLGLNVHSYSIATHGRELTKSHCSLTELSRMTRSLIDLLETTKILEQRQINLLSK
jgi:hypothetical protein